MRKKNFAKMSGVLTRMRLGSVYQVHRINVQKFVFSLKSETMVRGKQLFTLVDACKDRNKNTTTNKTKQTNQKYNKFMMATRMEHKRKTKRITEKKRGKKQM